jgi:hypothetical protein
MVIKSGLDGWDAQGAKLYRVLALTVRGNVENISVVDWKIILIWIVKNVICIHLVQGRAQWRADESMVINF